MAKINLIVCDIDRDPTTDAKTYRITVEGQTYNADLCTEHAAPLREVMKIAEAAGNTRAATAAARRRGLGTRVKTIEEIEAEKNAKPKKK